MMSALLSCARIMPPRYGNKRDFNSPSSNGRRSFVLKIMCVSKWVNVWAINQSFETGFVSGTEWRTIVAHSVSCGNNVRRNDSSPGTGGRNGSLNRGHLSPLPGLLNWVDDQTHSWR